MIKNCLIAVLLLVFVQGNASQRGWNCARAQQPAIAPDGPSAPQFDSQQFDLIAPLIDTAIANGEMPGAVVLIGQKDTQLYFRAFGHRSVEPEPSPMELDTVFDLASLTKPLATATAIMQLVEAGVIELDAPVAKYLPEFSQDQQAKITIVQLLTHTSGLIPDNALSDYQPDPATARANLLRLQPTDEPGSKFKYSDVGFLLLGEVVHRCTGKPLDQYVREHIFAPLKMAETTYVPNEGLRQRAAPTEQRDGAWIQGEVHDPRAFLLNGVAGHAGLFSTASDLSRYGRMILQQGQLDGATILKPETVQQMTAPFAVPKGIRGLGWDKQSGYSSNRGSTMSASAIGHGGFTGTAIWIDPELQLYVIFLSSRLHPDGKGAVNALAGKIGTIAADAVRAQAVSTKTD